VSALHGVPPSWDIDASEPPASETFGERLRRVQPASAAATTNTNPKLNEGARLTSAVYTHTSARVPLRLCSCARGENDPLP